VIGTRATLIALLGALLEPVELLRKFEAKGDFTARLAILEHFKNLPVGPVWDYHCTASGVPVGAAWLADVQKYERDVVSRR
jgi:L-rhamnose isomerase